MSFQRLALVAEAAVVYGISTSVPAVPVRSICQSLGGLRGLLVWGFTEVAKSKHSGPHLEIDSHARVTYFEENNEY